MPPLGSWEKRHAVTVYECNKNRWTRDCVRVGCDGEEIDVDVGFIVFNEPNYPPLIFCSRTSVRGPRTSG